jgi:hypothetical protein
MQTGITQYIRLSKLIEIIDLTTCETTFHIALLECEIKKIQIIVKL